MVTNNKVLTVSYGTFSCTLEGFEESFDTMKAIAEYFRDLAADDRYFGAEPPTPDAEMLARIAEKEIARRVSARMDQGTIVLSTNAPQPPFAAPSQTPASVPAPAAAPAAAAVQTPVQTPAQAPAAPAPAAPEVAPVAATPTPEVEHTPAPQPTLATPQEDETRAHAPSQDTFAEDVAPVETTPSVTDSVLSAIANDTLDTAPAEDALYIEDALDSVSDDTPIDLGAIAAVVSADEHAAEDQAATAAADAFAEDISDVAEESEEEIAAEVDTDAEEGAQEISVEADIAKEEAAEDNAAKDNVEEQSEDTTDAAPEALDIAADEDINAPLVLENAVEDNSDPFATDTAELSDWDTEEEGEADSADYEENSIAAKLERIRAVVSRSEIDTAEAAPTDADDTELNATQEEDLVSALNIFDETEDAASENTAPEQPEDSAEEDGAEEDSAEDAIANVIASEADLLADDDTYTADPVETSENQSETETEEQPLRARVVRMKKADFEEAVAAGLLEAEPVEEDADEEDAPASSLTPEDEAELLSELAKVEAELKQTDADEALSEPAEDNLFAEDLDDSPVASDTPAPAVTRAQQPEPDLSRLMAKADSKMQEPAGKGRRSAIAHLRAAVAATRAEKKNKSEADSTDDASAYRSDLADAVRSPSDATAEDAAQNKPAAAPLKLVAAQRVDATASTAEKPAQSDTPTQKAPRRIPVRPRRVSADHFDRDEAARAAAPVSSGNATLTGFTDYAKSVGASQLPESVEAAAAYLTYVEGMERFTRPMLMRMAREVNIPQFTREEGLRSFGQLLRQKKIEKLAGGRFTATQAINFQPRDREAG